MSSILKKSSRKERRLPIKGVCQISLAGTPNPVIVHINNLSTGGMNFTCKAPAFTEKSVIDIQFIVRGQKTLLQRGRIAYVLKSDQAHESKGLRFAVQFEQRLSEDHLTLLLQSFDFQATLSESNDGDD